MNRSSQHDFWLDAARVAFSNPFEEAPLSPIVDAEFASRISRLDQAGATHLRRYRAEERATMRTVFLFDACRRFQPELDRLVLDQIEKGDLPAAVPFATDLLGLLARRGIEGEEAEHAFAIFFQIRRAHHFIGAGLAGESGSMKKLRRQLWSNVFTHDMHFYERALWKRMEDFSTLLIGETGTGKGTAAVAIGCSGFIPFDAKKQGFAESFTRGLVSLNLSQYPEAMIESELFGHRKGAFPGATESHEGLLARCSPFGAVFLDEVGELSAPLQVRLLGVLRDRFFSPVGSHERVPFRGRLIAATHRPMAELRNGRFRDDFYHQLCSNAITLPPLRERLAEDRRELDQLLEKLVAQIAGDAANALLPIVRAGLAGLIHSNYPWPGNVREVEQSVRRIILTRSYSGAPLESSPDGLSELQAGITAGSLDADALLSAYCALLYARHGNLEEVARRTNLDRRTVKRHLTGTTRKR